MTLEALLLVLLMSDCLDVIVLLLVDRSKLLWWSSVCDLPGGARQFLFFER